MRRFDRLHSLEDRQLRSLARFDQLQADLRRVDAEPSRVTSGADWWRVTSRWRSRMVGVEPS
jgi:hypothetical protein